MAMRIPSQSELVRVWERASGRSSVERALILLGACWEEPREQLAALSIGQRDRRLLELYRGLFGTYLDAFATCPACSEPLEYQLTVEGLLTLHEKPMKELVVESDNVRVALRAPNSFDLEALEACADVDLAKNLLLERCVVSATAGGESIAPWALPESVIEQIDAKLAEAEEQAELTIQLQCSVCAHTWQVLLDVERFLWLKISALARRLLGEVHMLASAYGWSETDILSLGPARRQFYLDMVESWVAS